MLQMGDMKRESPDDQCLFEIASDQKGHFTSAQAAECGVSRSLLAQRARNGSIARERRGIYRLTRYPFSMHEEIMVGWLAVGRDVAVVSHQSALEVHDLSDVIADEIHVTVPRSRKDRIRVEGVHVHTTVREFEPLDVVSREGMRITSPIRTVLDIDEAWFSLEHIEAAARQVIQRGQATPAMFYERAMRYGGRFRNHLAHGQIRL